MKIARQGWAFIAAGFIVDGLGAGAMVWGAVNHVATWLIGGALLSALGTLFAAFCLYFFRDPERPLPSDHSKIYSPGDGVVLSVAHEDGAVTLRIFLSVFDVHIQRAPCSGRVESVEHKPGSFAAAMRDEAKANERSVMTIAPEGGRPALAVEQIAGLIARRIETWPKAGDSVVAGQRYGIIYFGSQAAVRFPRGAQCTVKAGDRVVGGVTEIGRWTS